MKFSIVPYWRIAAIFLGTFVLVSWAQGPSSKSGKKPKPPRSDDSIIVQELPPVDLDKLDIVRDSSFYELTKVGIISIGKKNTISSDGILSWGGDLPFIFIGPQPIDFSRPVAVTGFGNGFGFLEDSKICGPAGCGEIAATFTMEFSMKGIFYGPPECRLELDITDKLQGEMVATETTSVLTITGKGILSEAFEPDHVVFTLNDRVVDRFVLELGNVVVNNVWWLSNFDDGGASGCQSIDYGGIPDPDTFQELFDQLNKQDQNTTP